MKSDLMLSLKSGGEAKLIPEISHCIVTHRIPHSPHCVFHLTPQHLMVNLNLISSFIEGGSLVDLPSYDHLVPTAR